MDLISYLRQSRQLLWDPDVIPGLMRFLDPPSDGRILEVGCGTGFFTQLVTRQFSHGTVIGVDLSAEALGQAAGTLSQDAHFARADLFRLPFADRCFDYVVCHIVLTVLTEPSVALAEMRRVTRAGGVVAAIEPANEAFVHSADFLTEKQLEAERRVLLAAEKVRGRTVRLGARLPSLFAHCGLTDIRTKGYLSVTAVEELLRRTHRREFLELAWIQSVHRFLDGPHVREAVDAGLIDPSDLEQGLRPQYEHERAFRAGRTSDLGNEVFATPLFAVRGLVP